MTARFSFLLALLSFLGFLVVAALTLRQGGLHDVDARLLAHLYRHDRGAAHSLAEALRHLGELPAQVILVGVAAAIALRRGLVDRAIAAVVLVAGADLTAQLLKRIIVDGRYGPIARTFAVNEHSFPSGHATTMAALAFAYLLVVPPRLRPPVAIVGATLAVLVASAMVLLHRHWPSDAVGGLLFGSTWGLATFAAVALRDERAAKV